MLHANGTVNTAQFDGLSEGSQLAPDFRCTAHIDCERSPFGLGSMHDEPDPTRQRLVSSAKVAYSAATLCLASYRRCVSWSEVEAVTGTG